MLILYADRILPYDTTIDIHTCPIIYVCTITYRDNTHTIWKVQAPIYEFYAITKTGDYPTEDSRI